MFATQQAAARGGLIVDLSPSEQASILGGDSIWEILLKAVVNYVVDHSDEAVNGFIQGYQDGYAG